MSKVFNNVIALKPAGVDVAAASEQSAGDAYIEGFEHAIVAAAAFLARDDANIEAMRESLRLYRETYGPLPNDMVSTERRQDREIAALRLALQAANPEQPLNELETEIRPDLALATADAKIKKQTNSLRTALIRTMAAKIVAEEALEGAEKEIEDLKEQIKNTKADLRDLEIENDKLDNKLAELV